MIFRKISETNRLSPNEEPNGEQSPLVLRSPSLHGDIYDLSVLNFTNEDGVLKFTKPFIIGVCGGNCAGKIGVVNKFIETLGQEFITVLYQENFYKDTPNVIDSENILSYNFDDPDATDWNLMIEGLEHLCAGKPFNTPLYDIKQNRRQDYYRDFVRYIRQDLKNSDFNRES